MWMDHALLVLRLYSACIVSPLAYRDCPNSETNGVPSFVKWNGGSGVL